MNPEAIHVSVTPAMDDLGPQMYRVTIPAGADGRHLHTIPVHQNKLAELQREIRLVLNLK